MGTIAPPTMNIINSECRLTQALTMLRSKIKICYKAIMSIVAIKVLFQAFSTHYIDTVKITCIARCGHDHHI